MPSRSFSCASKLCRTGWLVFLGRGMTGVILSASVRPMLTAKTTSRTGVAISHSEGVDSYGSPRLYRPWFTMRNNLQVAATCSSLSLGAAKVSSSDDMRWHSLW